MKTQQFTIYDRLMQNTLTQLVNLFDQYHIPYAIVGGIAYQLRLTNLGQSKDLLRKTGDIDIAVDMRETEHPLSFLLNLYVQNHPRTYNDAHRLKIRSRNSTLFVNIEDSPKCAPKNFESIYYKIISESQKVNFKHHEFTIPSDPFLIITKLTQRGAREKHKADLSILIRILKNKDILPDEEIKSLIKEYFPQDQEKLLKIYQDIRES